MFEASSDQTYHPAGVNATLEIIQSWTSAVPKGKLLLLDLWADSTPLWNISSSFFGHTYVWCMLHNFGATDGMWGDLTQISNGPTTARRASGPAMVGTGMTMEGTNQNWVVYELMLDAPFRHVTLSEPEIEAWLRSYTQRRYGMADAKAEALSWQAWSRFRATAYATGLHSQMGHEPGLGYHAVDAMGGPHDDTYYGVLNGTTYRFPWYNLSHFVEGWGFLLDATAAASPGVPLRRGGLRHDVVDATREVLVQYSDLLRMQYSAALWVHDAKAAAATKAAILGLIDDLDEVLASDDGFLLGSWLESAKAMGDTPEQQALYEWNARSQLTLYLRDVGTPDYSGTMDYAAKHWSGLVGGYYRQRWVLYFGMVDEATQRHATMNCTEFVARSVALTYRWMSSKELHPNTTRGDALALAQAIYHKYAPLLLRPGGVAGLSGARGSSAALESDGAEMHFSWAGSPMKSDDVAAAGGCNVQAALHGGDNH
jgi:alpha-N-acetylglucosaminidase